MPWVGASQFCSVLSSTARYSSFLLPK